MRLILNMNLKIYVCSPQFGVDPKSLAFSVKKSRNSCQSARGRPEPRLCSDFFVQTPLFSIANKLAGKKVVRAGRIELPQPAWKAGVLPLNYARDVEQERE